MKIQPNATPVTMTTGLHYTLKLARRDINSVSDTVLKGIQDKFAQIAWIKKIPEQSDIFIHLNAKQKGAVDNALCKNYAYTRIWWKENNEIKIKEGFGESIFSLENAIKKMFKKVSK